MSNNDYECDDVSTVLMANPRRVTLKMDTSFDSQARDAALATDLIGTAPNPVDIEDLRRYVPRFFDANARNRATSILRLILGDNANADNLIRRLQAVPADDRGVFIERFKHECDLASANAITIQSVPNAPSTDSSLSSTTQGATMPFAVQDDPSRGSNEVAHRPGHANDASRRQRLPDPLLAAGHHGNPQQEEVAALRRNDRVMQVRAPANDNSNVAGGPAQINNQVRQVQNAAAMPMPAKMANQNQNNDNNNSNNNAGNPRNF